MMTRIRLLLLILTLVAASRAAADDVVYPPGSPLGLAPPPGMEVSTNFFGFEDPSTHAAIILATLPLEAYAELEKGLSAEALRRQGVVLERREPITLESGKAFLVIGRQEIDKTKVRKWILIGASPSLTALVTVQIPETAQSLYADAAIRDVLRTLAIRVHVPIEEQLGLLPFRITELAGFQVAAVAPGRAAILNDPPSDTQALPQPQILVTIAPGAPAQSADRDTFARDAFASVPNLREVRVTGAEPLRIGGQSGHQILAQARDATGAASLTVVQWLRFGGSGYMQLVGVSRADTWQEAYPRFRAVRDGIEAR
jgi:hypothetical protein